MNELSSDSDILIIKPYWANLILNGEKTMEIRSCSCKNKVNKRIYISKSGTQQIFGSVFLKSCIGPLSSDEFHAHKDLHRVETTMYKKNYGWIFSDVTVFDNPIPYKHKKGAIIWLKYQSL
tara:strand:+ start:197 stop:559 length:363 start_codon:yes stop_codon:yes gene_type:complete